MTRKITNAIFAGRNYRVEPFVRIMGFRKWMQVREEERRKHREMLTEHPGQRDQEDSTNFHHCQKVTATSVSVSSWDPFLVDSVGCVLLVSLTTVVPKVFSPPVWQGFLKSA